MRIAHPRRAEEVARLAANNWRTVKIASLDSSEKHRGRNRFYGVSHFCALNAYEKLSGGHLPMPDRALGIRNAR